jgi:hypothetical protein
MAVEGSRLRAILEIGEALRSLVLANDTSPVGAILFRIGNDLTLSDPNAPRVESTGGKYQRIMDEFMKEHLFRVHQNVISRVDFVRYFNVAEKHVFTKLGIGPSPSWQQLREKGLTLVKKEERLAVAERRFGRVLPKLLFQVGNEQTLRTPGLPRVDSRSRYQEVMDEYMKAHLFTVERKKMAREKFEEFFLAAERAAWRELQIDPTPLTLTAYGFTVLEKKNRLAVAEKRYGRFIEKPEPVPRVPAAKTPLKWRLDRKR